MSFNIFASKLREQAKEAAQVMKRLPTFDDMAAKDEYIHSEEYNVRGQSSTFKKATKTRNEDEQGGGGERLDKRKVVLDGSRSSSRSSSHHRRILPVDGSREGTTSVIMDEGSSCSTESTSWSLLDRPTMNTGQGPSLSSSSSITNPNSSNSSPPSDGDDRPSRSHSQSSLQQRAGTAPSASSSKPSTEKPPTSPPMPMLLSVVADALQDTPVVRHSSSKTGPSQLLLFSSEHSSTTDRNSNSNSYCTSDMHYGDDQSLDDDDFIDDDDPILSTQLPGQQRQTPPPPRRSVPKRPNRFLEDLDRRLQTPDHPEDIEAGLLPEAASSSLLSQERLPASSTSAAHNITGYGPFGGYFRKMAMTQVNRLLNRPVSPVPPATTMASSRAPLTRDRPKKRAPDAHEEVDFHVVASSSVLAQEELAELEQLKRQSTLGISSSHGKLVMVMMESLQENRRFLLIALTLVLALFVYFYKQSVIRR